MDIKIRDVVDAVIALIILILCGGAEAYVMIKGVPAGVDQVIAGRVLGTFDALMLIVGNWYFGNTRSSKDQVDAITSIGQAAANTPITIQTPAGDVVRTTTPLQEQHSHM
jgi:hypothetical protein